MRLQLTEKNSGGEVVSVSEFASMGELEAWQSALEIPNPSHTFEIEDISASFDKVQKRENGRRAREACLDVLDLVAGYNMDRQLTLEQITTLQTTFAAAEGALRSGRPWLAKVAIQAITPDEVLVPVEVKEACLELLSEY